MNTAFPSRIASFTAAAILAASMLLASCGKSEQAKADTTPKPAAPAPVTVRVSPVRSMELQRSVRIVGSLAGIETITLSNRVTGVISKISVDRGDYVTPGQK